MATHSSVLAWRIPGRGSLVGCHLWGCTELDTTEATWQEKAMVPMSLQWGWGYLSQSLNCVSSSPPQQLWGGDGAIYLSP